MKRRKLSAAQQQGDVTDSPPSLEKLREEIKGLRLQRLLAILSASGAMLAFAVTRYADIRSMLYRPPVLKVVVEDSYIKETGRLQVLRHGLTNQGAVVETSVSEALDWLQLDPGNYDVVILLNKQEYLRTSFVLQAGDRESIFIPARDASSILITVTNRTPRPIPGSSLELAVQSSGNGFLWIYDLRKDGEYALVYPPATAIGSSNEVQAGEVFKIPDSFRNGIFAGRSLGEERLLFVVTSLSARTTADEIASRLTSSTATKAAAGTINENWGASILSYQVGL